MTSVVIYTGIPMLLAIVGALGIALVKHSTIVSKEVSWPVELNVYSTALAMPMPLSISLRVSNRASIPANVTGWGRIVWLHPNTSPASMAEAYNTLLHECGHLKEHHAFIRNVFGILAFIYVMVFTVLSMQTNSMEDRIGSLIAFGALFAVYP